MGFWTLYMGIEGGGFTDTADVIVTKRLTLFGTATSKLTLLGTSQQALTLMGSTP